ncbi:hypothetical protein ACKWTF_013167 [Chironomus riparius]
MLFMSYFIKLIMCLMLFSIASVYSNKKPKHNTCSPEESCLPHFECKAVTNLTSKGFLTQDERAYLRTKFCKRINYLDHFCCDTESDQNSSLDSRLSSHLPSVPKCGIYFQDKITLGENTFIDEYPWYALIQYLKPDNEIEHRCGGSLINKRFVLTAAHCYRRIPKKWKLSKVRLGEWDQRTNPDCQTIENEVICNNDHVEVPVVEVIVHPEYYSLGAAQYNDIALLKLQQDVEYTAWIKPICLPLDSRIRTTDFTSHNLEVAGFGLTETGYASPVKKRVYLDGVAQAQCQRSYRTIGVRIFDNQICFGGMDGKDSCNGDSGSPLMKFGKFPHSKFSHYMQVGLVSFGPKNCGTDNFPGVYVRLADYMDWIIDNSQLN